MTVSTGTQDLHRTARETYSILSHGLLNKLIAQSSLRARTNIWATIKYNSQRDLGALGAQRVLNDNYETAIHLFRNYIGSFFSCSRHELGRS